MAGVGLTLGLPENHVWNGSEARSPHGRTFNPNIPTERYSQRRIDYEATG